MGHLALGCSKKLEKKVQVSDKKQASTQKMNKKKAPSKRVCYLWWEKGHMANSCPKVTLLSLLIILYLGTMVVVPHWWLTKCPATRQSGCFIMLLLT